MEQTNSSKHRSTDRSSDKSRRSSAPEKHEDKVSAGDGGKNRLSSSVVRGATGGKGEHPPSDKVVEPPSSKKKTLKDFQQTAAAASTIESLNSKKNISPSPERSNRSTPSPPNSALDPSRGLGDRFGFTDYGPNDNFGSFGAETQSAEQRSRATTEYLMSQGRLGGHDYRFSQQQFPEFSGPRGDHTTPDPRLMRGEQTGLGPRQLRGDLAGPDPRQIQQPDLSGFSSTPSLFMMDMMNKFQTTLFEQNALWQKLQEEKMATNKSLSSAPGAAATPSAATSDNSGSESEEDMEVEMDWSGQPIGPRTSEISISPEAMDCWTSYLGLDERGIQNGAFKAFAKKTKKVKQFIEGKKAMNPQEIEPEIPRLWGWQLKEEEELSSTQQVMGALAVATCASVDAARATVDDLKASCKDFEDGVISDPSTEAAKICAAVADVIEDKIIANNIQSLKFAATVFGSLTLKRRSLALRQVSDPDTKRVLEKTAPNEEYLFGGKVKEGVQKSRDSHQMKKIMQPPKRDWKSNKSFKPNYQKNGGGKNAPQKSSRPMSDRFKGGDKKYKKYRRNDKKKPKDDE